MPLFRIEGPNVPRIELTSDNWMGALGDVLQKLSIDNLNAIECDVRADGDIEVRSPSHSFVIHEIVQGPAAAAAVRRPLPHDLPEASVLDAPEPYEAPAWRTHEDSADQLVASVESRCKAILDAETAEAACAVALDLLMEFVPAESGAVLLADRRSRDLRFVAARGPRARGLAGTPVPSGRGIAGLTVRAGIALTIREAAQDPRHYGEVDQRTGYRTQGILSVPIRGARAALGCLQLLNPFGNTGFLPWHQTAAQVVAARLAERIQ
jgi:hypothetical protein